MTTMKRTVPLLLHAELSIAHYPVKMVKCICPRPKEYLQHAERTDYVLVLLDQPTADWGSPYSWMNFEINL